jgi:hypothetical protein
MISLPLLRVNGDGGEDILLTGNNMIFGGGKVKEAINALCMHGVESLTDIRNIILYAVPLLGLILSAVMKSDKKLSYIFSLIVSIAGFVILILFENRYFVSEGAEVLEPILTYNIHKYSYIAIALVAVLGIILTGMKINPKPKRVKQAPVQPKPVRACVKCGAKLEDGVVFCPECGTKNE